MNLFARTVPSASAFPERKAGRLLRYPFRGLLSVHSRYGLHAHQVAIATFFTEGFSGFVTSTAASIVTGRNEPAPGRDFHPLWTSAFPRRTLALRLAVVAFLGWASAYIQYQKAPSAPTDQPNGQPLLVANPPLKPTSIPESRAAPSGFVNDLTAFAN
jgi:hypothetical protein